MVVIQGIQTAIKIAPIVYKVGKVVWKASMKTKRGGQWLTRHPKIAKYGTVAAGAGGLLLDLTNIDYSAILPKTPSYNKTGQTRNYVVQSHSRCRDRFAYNSPQYWSCIRRQKYRNRM